MGVEERRCVGQFIRYMNNRLDIKGRIVIVGVFRVRVGYDETRIFQIFGIINGIVDQILQVYRINYQVNVLFFDGYIVFVYLIIKGEIILEVVVIVIGDIYA